MILIAPVVVISMHGGDPNATFAEIFIPPFNSNSSMESFYFTVTLKIMSDLLAEAIYSQLE